jgi:hypothetical protein
MENKVQSISELIKNTDFILSVDKQISELRTKRYNRPRPKDGYHYTRDGFDRMNDSQQFNKEFFLKNIEDIWNKKSSLSSEIRGVVQYVCDKALAETLKIKK